MSFIAGLFLGVCTGITIMALLQIAKDSDERRRMCGKCTAPSCEKCFYDGYWD